MEARMAYRTQLLVVSTVSALVIVALWVMLVSIFSGFWTYLLHLI
jgi:hypothetical protein